MARKKKSQQSDKEEEATTFDVEKILDKKVEGGTAYYLIKWLGYGHEDNTWEPAVNLWGCQNALNEFEESFKGANGLKRSREEKENDDIVALQEKLNSGRHEFVEWKLGPAGGPKMNKKHQCKVRFSNGTEVWHPIYQLKALGFGPRLLLSLDSDIRRCTVPAELPLLKMMREYLILKEDFTFVSSGGATVGAKKEGRGRLVKKARLPAKRPVTIPLVDNALTKNIPREYLAFDETQDWEEVQSPDIPHYETWKRLLQNARKPLPLIDNSIVDSNGKRDKNGPPTEFVWIDENRVPEGFEEPEEGFLVGCECSGLSCHDCDCPSNGPLDLPFAYTEQGLLKADYGFNSIVECNMKCFCSHTCVNRTVQNGRKLPLMIYRHEKKGWGVKTLRALPAGTFVDEYVGELIPSAEADKKAHEDHQRGSTYLFDLDGFLHEDEEPIYTLDANKYGNVTHFFNHSCNPNMKSFSVLVDSLDHRLHRIAFFTIRDVQAGEELTFHYAGRFEEDTAKNANRRGRPQKRKKKFNDRDNEDEEHFFRCFCGEPNCEKRIQYRYDVA